MTMKAFLRAVYHKSHIELVENEEKHYETVFVGVRDDVPDEYAERGVSFFSPKVIEFDGKDILVIRVFLK